MENKQLEARLKQSCRYGSMQFFSRTEYVKHEWRPVPLGAESQALENEYLETRPSQRIAAKIVEPVINPQSVTEITENAIDASSSDALLDAAMEDDADDGDAEKTPAKRTGTPAKGRQTKGKGK